MMYSPIATAPTHPAEAAYCPQPPAVEGSRKAHPLLIEETAEVQAFLSLRVIHTISLRGYIRDNGLISPLNRGTFYGYRNEGGQLEGVALIGHATLIEAHTEAALAAFALVAQEFQQIHMVMGEQETVQGFWHKYAQAGQPLRLVCREILLEKCWPVSVLGQVEGLRQATLDDLGDILPVQAELAFRESGVNPLVVDPEGFRARCARRIEQGRTWVFFELGQLVFKADVMAETPEAIYVEGVYVCPGVRGKGNGLRCLSQLDRNLLKRTQSVCLLVNEENHAARAFYQRSGYKFRGLYETIFLKNQDA